MITQTPIKNKKKLNKKNILVKKTNNNKIKTKTKVTVKKKLTAEQTIQKDRKCEVSLAVRNLQAVCASQIAYVKKLPTGIIKESTLNSFVEFTGINKDLHRFGYKVFDVNKCYDTLNKNIIDIVPNLLINIKTLKVIVANTNEIKKLK